MCSGVRVVMETWLSYSGQFPPFFRAVSCSRLREAPSAHTYLHNLIPHFLPHCPILHFPDKVIIDVSATTIIVGFWIMTRCVTDSIR